MYLVYGLVKCSLLLWIIQKTEAKDHNFWLPVEHYCFPTQTHKWRCCFHYNGPVPLADSWIWKVEGMGIGLIILESALEVQPSTRH